MDTKITDEKKFLLDLKKENLITGLRLGIIDWFQYLEAYRLLEE